MMRAANLQEAQRVTVLRSAEPGRVLTKTWFPGRSARSGIVKHFHAEAVEYARSRLPAEWRDASCHYQFSASAGMKAGIRVHLWFWLSVPMGESELTGYFKRARCQAKVDVTPFRTVQIHYTARPVFRGVEDPFEGRERSGLLAGDRDAVELGGGGSDAR